jgi:hypothetical protein
MFDSSMVSLSNHQSLRVNVVEIGVLEWWSNGVMQLKPNTPILQRPISPTRLRLACPEQSRRIDFSRASPLRSF